MSFSLFGLLWAPAICLNHKLEYYSLDRALLNSVCIIGLVTILLISNNRTHSTTFPALSWPHHLRLVTEELGPRSSHVFVRLFTLYSGHFSSARRLRRRRRRPCGISLQPILYAQGLYPWMHETDGMIMRPKHKRKMKRTA